MNVKRFLSTVFICIFISGCASGMTNLSPQDKSATIAIQLGNYYKIIYDQAEFFNENGTQQQKEFMVKNVNPTLNKAKKMILIYQRLMLQWKMMGGNEPNGLIEYEKNISVILKDVSVMMVKVYEMVK